MDELINLGVCVFTWKALPLLHKKGWATGDVKKMNYIPDHWRDCERQSEDQW